MGVSKWTDNQRRKLVAGFFAAPTHARPSYLKIHAVSKPSIYLWRRTMAAEAAPKSPIRRVLGVAAPGWAQAALAKAGWFGGKPAASELERLRAENALLRALLQASGRGDVVGLISRRSGRA